MTRRSRTLRFATVLTFVSLLSLSRSATAEPQPTAADLKRLESELARVQQQVAEQRLLILQVMQMQDGLLRYLQSTSGGAANAPAPLPSAVQMPAPASAGSREAAAPRSVTPGGTPSPAAGGGAEKGEISGRVTVNGAAPSEAYVFLDGPRSVPSHPPTIEIRQESRRFVPAVAVVPVGSHVLFPNRDTVFHNVFSNTPGDAFDVGTLKAGQEPRPVTMLKAGHVEVFCNIHSKMRADVLVVPNAHWTRVRPDGTFALPGVPAGQRRIAVWGPTLKPVSQQIEVKGSGATATFSTEERSATPHTNKSGGAYGSYEN